MIVWPNGVRRGFESRVMMYPPVISEVNEGSVTLGLFDGNEAPKSAETSFREFGLRRLIRDFCSERR